MAHRTHAGNFPDTSIDASHATPVDPASAAGALTSSEAGVRQAAGQAYRILHFAFTVAPVLAGLDKFFHLLTDWDKYLAPAVNSLLGGNGHTFMLAAGVVEVVAGIGVALRPRIFAYVVAAWLMGIIVNLLLVPGFFDVALRDLGLALGALALGRLSREFDRGPA